MRQRGFSLVEILVALVVVSIGLLGVAKIQALAYASTNISSSRSLAAIQAASLASAMRANRAYWSSGLAPASITVTGSKISDATLNAAATADDACRQGGGGSCTPAVLAAYDLHQWANALNSLLPSPQSDIACPNATAPVSCTIRITWSEKLVAVNGQGASGAMQAPTYTLYVEP
jgi:type IV pilus assembly protein PilV